MTLSKGGLTSCNRWHAIVEYEGTHYRGWQTQTQAPLKTVQGQVEWALSQVAAHPIKIIAAGRTDAGVHAQHQVIHFDTSASRQSTHWIRGANCYLPDDISLKWVGSNEDGSFHARYSALSRTYRYIILPMGARSALWNRFVLSLLDNFSDLNLGQMQLAARSLVGEYDFTSFRSSECQSKSPRRQILFAEISAHFPFIVLTLKANSFLHHMVRNIMGTLLEVGRNKRTVKEFEALFQEQRDRRLAGMMAPARGLYLVDVEYPEKFSIPRNSDFFRSSLLPFMA